MTSNEKYESIAELILGWCDGLKITYMPFMDIAETTYSQYPNVKYSSGIVLFTPNKLGHGDVLFLFDDNKSFVGMEVSHVSKNRLSIIKDGGVFCGIPYKTISVIGIDKVYISF